MIKRVVSAIYAHKTNAVELLANITDLRYRYKVQCLIEQFCYEYAVLKYDSKKHTLSFIKSPDWEIANEPIVGDSICYDLTVDNINLSAGKVVKQCKNPKIYHNKWQFVSADYRGFDIEQAKQRTVLWNSIPEIRENKSRIGNQAYWFGILDKYGISR